MERRAPPIDSGVSSWAGKRPCRLPFTHATNSAMSGVPFRRRDPDGDEDGDREGAAGGDDFVDGDGDGDAADVRGDGLAASDYDRSTNLATS